MTISLQNAHSIMNSLLLYYIKTRCYHSIYFPVSLLVVANTEIGLEVNACKTKYMVMSRDLNAGQSHNIKTDNSSFERVDELKENP
jgi:hypothetical protein